MPASVTETESYTATVTGPAGGDARTATSVRNMGVPLASRSLWNRKRLDELLGTHKAVESVDASTDVIGITAHPFSNGDVLRMISIGGSLPGGILYGTALHVINATADDFQVSYVTGGPAVNLTTTGSGTLYVFKIAEPLKAIVHPAFTTAKGDTIPAGPLVVTLAGYFLPTQGGTITGAVTHSGNNAYTVERCGALNDTATQTFTGTNKHHFYCPDVSQDSTYTVANPTAEGQWFVVSRRRSLNAFLADFKRVDTDQIVRFPASAKSWALIRASNQDGDGLKWHADQYGGDAIPST